MKLIRAVILLLAAAATDGPTQSPVVLDANVAAELRSKYESAVTADVLSTKAQEMLINKDDPCEHRIRQLFTVNAKAEVSAYNAALWKLRSENLDKSQKDWTYNRDKAQFEPPKDKPKTAQ